MESADRVGATVKADSVRALIAGRDVAWRGNVIGCCGVPH